MRTEDDVWARLQTVRTYYEAGFFQEPEHAFFGASELLWTLGFEEGSGAPYLHHASIYHEESGEHVYL